MFGGMPAYQVSTLYPGNWLSGLDKAFKLFLPHPGGYLFLYCLGFFILLLCLDVDPWLAHTAGLFAESGRAVLHVYDSARYSALEASADALEDATRWVAGSVKSNLVDALAGSVPFLRLAGTALGGFLGAKLVKVLPAGLVRNVISAAGCVMTAIYVYRYWL